MRVEFPSWEEMLDRTADSVIEDDPHLGRLFAGTVGDLVRPPTVQPPLKTVTTVVFGPGAALVDNANEVWYCDLAKRHGLTRIAEGPTVLGKPDDQYPDFRRMVFVDWPAVDRHRKQLGSRLDRFVDLFDPNMPRHMDGKALQACIRSLVGRPFRTLPHFMPGSWGGHWMQQTFNMHLDAKNLAWSYELIAPEAGVLFGTAEASVEVPLDMILTEVAGEVMGPDVVAEFGNSFPIRFDYLDTMGGGHLSVHCHPLEDYMRDIFGWPYTQHESYYIMATSPGSFIYLGLRDDVDVAAFENKTRRAERHSESFEIDEFINTVSAVRHELYLIPAGTPHGASVGNVVLEISATPYLYSLRFYDYLRRGLDGELRPIHLKHAFANLDEERRGAAIENLVARPQIVRSGDGWHEELMASRTDLFFEVWRSTFTEEFTDNTDGRFHILNLVEGQTINIETDSASHLLNYGETILIPASTGKYRLVNLGVTPARTVKARVRPRSKTPSQD